MSLKEKIKRGIMGFYRAKLGDEVYGLDIHSVQIVNENHRSYDPERDIAPPERVRIDMTLQFAVIGEKYNHSREGFRDNILDDYERYVNDNFRELTGAFFVEFDGAFSSTEIVSKRGAWYGLVTFENVQGVMFLGADVVASYVKSAATGLKSMNDLEDAFARHFKNWLDKNHPMILNHAIYVSKAEPVVQKGNRFVSYDSDVHTDIPQYLTVEMNADFWRDKSVGNYRTPDGKKRLKEIYRQFQSEIDNVLDDFEHYVAQDYDVRREDYYELNSEPWFRFYSHCKMSFIALMGQHWVKPYVKSVPKSSLLLAANNVKSMIESERDIWDK